MRTAALTALRQIGGAQHIPAIIPLLNDPDAAIRREAMRALANFGDATCIEPLEAIMQGEEKPFLKEEAQTAIAQIEKRLGN
jgi:HEAT repeat protein